ncbi:MAG: BrnA antitoxin family protein [Caulobacteraceae bacterium]
MSKTEFSPEEQAQIDYLIALPEDQIDLTDVPEISDEAWATARRFYCPNETPVTLRLDADVLAWFKAQAEGASYQTEINRVLREHMTAAQTETAA